MPHKGDAMFTYVNQECKEGKLEKRIFLEIAWAYYDMVKETGNKERTLAKVRQAKFDARLKDGACSTSKSKKHVKSKSKKR